MSTSNSEAPVLDSYQAVVSAYCDFLTVAIHTILFERKIYPEHSFIKARKYNFPVRQSRHPKVCSWIQDAVAAVESEMLRVGRAIMLSYHVNSALFFSCIEYSIPHDHDTVTAMPGCCSQRSCSSN